MNTFLYRTRSGTGTVEKNYSSNVFIVFKQKITVPVHTYVRTVRKFHVIIFFKKLGIPYRTVVPYRYLSVKNQKIIRDTVRYR